MKLYPYLLVVLFFSQCQQTNSEVVRCATLTTTDGLVQYRGTLYSGKCRDTTDQMIEVRSYRKGQAHGTWEKYHENGTLAYKGNYTDGNIDGDFTSYHPNGAVKGQGTLDKGFRVGSWIYYDSLGKEIQKKIYSRDGILIE